MGQPLASERLHAIAVRMRRQGEGAGLRRMSATMRTAAQPLVRNAEQAARQQLPKSGGLNELVASRHTTVSVLTGARSAGVRLKRPRKDAASYQTNRGYVYHKTFGELRGEPPWKRQEVPAAANWWDDTMRRGSPVVRQAIVAEMNRVAREIQGY